MQLFMRGSEEGVLPGLNWIKGVNKRFSFDLENAHLTIPHMGWNDVNPRPNSWFFNGSNSEERFYFVHSYHATCDHPEDVLATTLYGYDFASVVLKGNIIGTQFHPEKSHRFGMAFLSRFAAWDGYTE
jgi:imidazole glycerol-phosphate synthase subunit HisH